MQLRDLPVREWPDDCPTCGARMSFDFVPAGDTMVPKRKCPCGVTVRAEEVITQ